MVVGTIPLGGGRRHTTRKNTVRGWIRSKIRFEDAGKVWKSRITDIPIFLTFCPTIWIFEVLPQELFRSTGTLADAAGGGTHRPCCWPFEGGRPTPKWSARGNECWRLAAQAFDLQDVIWILNDFDRLYSNVGKWLINQPPQTMEGKEIKFFNWLWRESSFAIDSLLVNVLGTMDWILYWQMYCWLAGWLLAAFAFFFPFLSCPFISFHFLSFLSFPFISSHFISFHLIIGLCIGDSGLDHWLLFAFFSSPFTSFHFLS